MGTLHRNLTKTTIDMSSFQFSSSVFSALSKPLFKGVKNEWGMDVFQAVAGFAEFSMLPQLVNCLSQQRGMFYSFDTHESQCNVFQQVESVTNLSPTTYKIIFFEHKLVQV